MRTMMRAFTLVELLVAIAIIAVLAALILAAAGSASDRGRITETESMLDQVAAAVVRFQGETGYYPLPTGSSEMPCPGTDLTSWYPTGDEGWQEQQLFWRLGEAMDDDAKRAARTAAEVAAVAANPVLERPVLHGLWRQNNTVLDRRVTGVDEAAIWLQQQFDSLVGNEEAEAFRGPAVKDSNWTHPGGSATFKGSTVSNLADFKEATKLLTLMTRGWAKLEIMRQRGVIAKVDVERAHTSAAILGLSDIPDGLRDGGQILDAWGSPIGYINASGHSIKGTRDFHGSMGLLSIATPAHARAAIGDRNGDGEIDLEDLRSQPPVDQLVDRNGDGTIDATDWGSLLWNALPGYERGFILVSAGLDGRWPVVYGEDGGDDDIYHRGGVE